MRLSRIGRGTGHNGEIRRKDPAVSRNRILIVIGAVAAVLAVGVVVVVTTSGDTGRISTPDTRPVAPPTTATVPPTAPPTAPPTTSPTPPTTAPGPPPTTVVIPPSTVAPAPPTVPPTPAPTAPPPPPTTVPPTVPPGPSDPGITATEIRLAVIADSPDAVDGVKAWAATVNKKGLAGRTVVLDVALVGGDPVAYAAAVEAACTRAFAIVGSQSAGDRGIGTATACGIPNLPARAFSDEQRRAPNTFAAVPTDPARLQVGGFQWLAKTEEGCCAQYVVRSTDPARAAATIASAAAADTVPGFTDVGGTALADDAPQGAYAPSVATMKTAGATFGRSDLAFPSTIRFRAEAQAQGVAGVTWFCLEQCYDPDFTTQGGSVVDGTFVQIGITPFEDADAVPAVKKYLAAGGPRSQTGVESAAAGVLFQTAVTKAYGPDRDKNAVTRAAVLAALANVSSFNAGGLIGKTDVAAQVPNGCFVLMRVDGTGFTRARPTKPGDLDCAPDNLTPGR
jgi:hypothetical protein